MVVFGVLDWPHDEGRLQRLVYRFCEYLLDLFVAECWFSLDKNTLTIVICADNLITNVLSGPGHDLISVMVLRRLPIFPERDLFN